jgi:hypothetical protein
LTLTKGITWVAVGGPVTVNRSDSGAQTVIIAAGNGEMSFTNFIFDGTTNTTTSVMHLQNGANNKTFIDCTWTCGSGAAQLINFSAAATGITLTRPTFSGTPSTAAINAQGAAGSTVTIADLTVSSFTSARILWVVLDTAAWTIDRGTVAASLTSKAFTFDAGGNVAVKNITATLTNAPDSFFYVATASKTGNVDCVGNNVTYSGTVSDTPVINVTNGTHITTITGNSITANEAGQAQNGIQVSSQSAAVNISDNTVTFNGTTSNTVVPISVQNVAAGSTTLTLSGNTVTSTQVGARGILVGSDTSTAGDNHIDGATITGNTVYLTLDAAGVHGIEYGYNKNGVITGNYVYGGQYGIVIKGNETYTAGYVAYNILQDNSYEEIRVKGVKNLPVYNNTFYLSSGRVIQNGLLYITVNADSGGATSTGTIAKNNTFYSQGGNNTINCDADSASGLTVDNNLHYMASGVSPVYAKVGATQYTGTTAWTDWQTAGYDANGVNGNPQFRSTSDFRTMASGAGINKGVDVGLTTDFLGKPIRGVPDIGAYEFQSVAGGMLMGLGVGF